MGALYGENILAGIGLSLRLEPLLLALPIAMTASVPPLVGVNIGANNLQRVKDTVLKSFNFTIAWQLVVSLLVFIFAGKMGGLFSSSEEVIRTVVWYLRIVSISYAFQGIVIVASSAFNAAQAPIYSLIVNVARAFIFVIPLGFIGSHIWGFQGLLLGVAIGNMCTGLLTLLLSRRLFFKDENLAV